MAKVVAKVKANAHPHSGSKKVGICVELNSYGGPSVNGSGGSKHHFPDGCKWRYSRVLDFVMLEVMDSNGAIIYQCHAGSVQSVSGPGYVQPLWLSREYPTPAEEA